ncbi:AAA family ATPase [Pseudonocardia alni]|uniref:AAA family ATPase n=1 Tax=Pseudonocardia alni TaxID=33907 RepID=UPI00280A794C|nr:AAA family ATPase [Pseudonocardia alni]
MSADVVILTGPPGAGKSTTARVLAATYPASVHLHADDFWHYIVSGATLPYLPESDEQNQVVMGVIRRAAFGYAAGGFTTVIDGIIGPWMLRHFDYLDEAVASVRLHYAVLRPAREETVRRAVGRMAPDALVDEEVVTVLWEQFSDLGRLEGHVIDTTDQEPAETVRVLSDAVAADRLLLDTAARSVPLRSEHRAGGTYRGAISNPDRRGPRSI